MTSNDAVQSLRNHECTLVIMAKAPRDGQVKTRLAQKLPVQAVTELYRCLLLDTLTLAHSLRKVNVAIMCPAPDVEEFAHIAGPETRVVAQQGEGLAAALTSVFAQFAAPVPRRVIAFNSDSPHLSASVLANAFEILAEHDVVIGPTFDGGYYLVGAKDSNANELFRDDGMGTASALEALLARARSLQRSVGFADPFYDIDLGDDLARLAEELRVAPGRAPRTAAWLKQWQQIEPQPRSTAADL
jgi:rSAM/selenodomain-associated transferase 1